AGVGLFGQYHLNAHQRCLVGQHRDKASMWKVDECLVIPLPQSNRLFPAVILPNDKSSNAMLDKVIDDATACHVKITVHLALAFISEDFEAMRCKSPVRQKRLIAGTTLVVELVQ